VIVCAGKLADANVPVHVPAMFTTGPIGAEIDVDSVGAVALQLVSATASDSGTTKPRYENFNYHPLFVCGSHTGAG
jgi:hypothetical protein